MTSKQRAQYMGLSVVEGFIFYARTLSVEPKTVKAFDRIAKRCGIMKAMLGVVELDTDHRHILKKYDSINSILKRYSDGDHISVMVYINAVIMMVNRVQDNIPAIDIRREWGKLEVMLLTLYTHLEEIDAIRDVDMSNSLGVDITLAVLE